MLKKSLPTLLLAVALLSLAWLASQSPRARFSNLGVPADSFPEVYLQSKTGGSDKCLVGGRNRTTAKRSESKAGKASWRCRIEGGAPYTFVAESKLEPSYLFVPVTAVHDLAYPLVYGALRQHLPLPMPTMRWVHFFHDRQFQGLYLEIQLPTRAFAEAQQLGRLELLAVDGDHLLCFDRKLRPVCPIYNLAVADGVFPLPADNAVSRQLFALAGDGDSEDGDSEDGDAEDGDSEDGDSEDGDSEDGDAEGGERLFVISDGDYRVLYPMPLPVALHRLLPRQDVYQDQRYRRWLDDGGEGDTDQDGAAAQVLASARRDLLANDALGALRRDLPSSLAATCEILECDPQALLARLETSPSVAWLQEAGG